MSRWVGSEWVVMSRWVGSEWVVVSRLEGNEWVVTGGHLAQSTGRRQNRHAARWTLALPTRSNRYPLVDVKHLDRCKY